MPGRKQVLLFRGRGCGDRCKRHQPCPPAQQLDGLTIRDVRRLRQSLVRLGVVQAQLAIHRPPNGCLSPFWMLHQRAAFDPLRACPAIGLALATFLWLETMQLPMMPDERSNANQTQIIRSSLPANRARCQHPGINAVRFPYLNQLLARFLQAQLIPQRFGFVALFGLNRSQLAQFRVEPLFAYFQRRKALIPAPFSLGASLDVFDHEDADREELTEEPRQTQFPLPACPGRRRQFLLALLPVLTRLPARRFSIAAGAAHAGTSLLCILDAIPGFGLDIQVGMRCREHAIPLTLAAGINPHGERLDFPRCWLSIQPDTEQATFPKCRCLATFDPATSAGWRCRHQWMLIAVDYRDKHVR